VGWKLGQEFSRGFRAQHGEQFRPDVFVGCGEGLRPIGGVELDQGACGFFQLAAIQQFSDALSYFIDQGLIHVLPPGSKS
jgi:hypothetical protein